MPAPGTVVSVGTTNIVLSVTDASLNTANCNFDVVVSDNTPPTIACPGDQNVGFNASCQFVLPDYTGLATAADNCGTATVTQSPVAGTTINATTLITLTVTDGSTNTAFCTFNVIPADTTIPTITCPSAVTANTSDDGTGNCTTTVSLGNPTVVDNCTAVGLLIVTNDAPATFPSGLTVVTWTVNDGNGNTQTCTQNVTVTDDENPTITCPIDITVSNDAGNCYAIVTYYVPTSDNCPGQTIAQTAGIASGTAFPIGTKTNTFVVTDASGNTATCNFTVTVNDTELPTFLSCPNNITVDNDIDSCDAIVTYITPTASDNCGVQPIVKTDTAGLSSGSTFPV